jgi:hypothetical protein
MKLLFAGSALLLSGLAAISQQIPSKPKQHVLTVGAGFKELEDLYIQPRSVEGNVLMVGYSFLKQSETGKQGIYIEWNHGSLSGSGANVKTNDFGIRFSQAFSLLKSKNRKLNGFWGYSINTSPSYISVDNKDGKKYSWSTSSGLSFYQSVVYTAGSNRLALDIYVPLIGLASRPEENDYYHHTVNGVLYDSYSNLFATSLHNQRAVSATLDFSTAVGKEVRVVVGGRYDYSHLEKEKVYTDNKVGLYAGIACSFN